jgi:hypothetical protein
MNRIPKFYPGTSERVASPFYVGKCCCGHKQWQVFKKGKCAICEATLIGIPANQFKREVLQ